MKRRPVVIGLATLGIILLAMGWRRFGATRNEPRYEGHPISYWARQCVPATNRWPFSVALSDPAERALRAMGTNALPTLLSWMRYPYAEDDPRPKAMVWLGRHQLGFCQVLLTPGSYRPDLAALALHTLGTNAQPAVPALTAMLSEQDNAQYAGAVLALIGPPGAAALETVVPAVADELTRANLVGRLQSLVRPERHAEFEPLLIQRLNEDEAQSVRVSAAQVLGVFTNAPSAALALANAVRAGDRVVRAQAGQSLARFSPEALAAAAPVLEQLLTSTNLAVRNEAANLLPFLPRGQTNAATR